MRDATGRRRRFAGAPFWKGTAMSKYNMPTRPSHGALQSPHALEELERAVMDRVRAERPDVAWAGSCAVLGPHDYVDPFDAPDNEAAMKLATIVRTFGHAQTEVWLATEWQRYKEMVRALPGGSR